MPDRSYDQYCPIAVALDELGDRWTLLVLRELLIADNRFVDLSRTLHPIAPNLLTSRLRELEHGGLVERVELPPPAARTVYRATEAGRRVAPVLAALARYGLRRLGPAPTDRPVRPASAVWGLLVPRLNPTPAERSGGAHLAVRLEVDGERFDLDILDGRVRAELRGEPDVVVRASAATIAALPREGDISGERAGGGGEESERFHCVGTPEAIARFTRIFAIDLASLSSDDHPGRDAPSGCA